MMKWKGGKCNNRSVVFMVTIVSIALSALTIHSCVHAPYVLPESQQTGDPTICFERDILPIFQSNCAKGGCHSAAAHEEGYVLDNYEDIVRKGIVRGNPAASIIYQSLVYKKGEKAMPQGAPALTGYQLDLIKRWILGEL